MIASAFDAVAIVLNLFIVSSRLAFRRGLYSIMIPLP